MELSHGVTRVFGLHFLVYNLGIFFNRTTTAPPHACLLTFVRVSLVLDSDSDSDYGCTDRGHGDPSGLQTEEQEKKAQALDHRAQAA